jgi:hypothetical protein
MATRCSASRTGALSPRLYAVSAWSGDTAVYRYGRHPLGKTYQFENLNSGEERDGRTVVECRRIPGYWRGFDRAARPTDDLGAPKLLHF